MICLTKFLEPCRDNYLEIIVVFRSIFRRVRNIKMNDNVLISKVQPVSVAYIYPIPT